MLLGSVLGAASSIAGVGGGCGAAVIGSGGAASSSTGAAGAGPGSGGATAASSSGAPTGGSTPTTSSPTTGTSGGTAATTTMTSSGDPACTSCIEGSCSADALAQCLADAACTAWFDCYRACSDSVCATTCDQEHEVAKPWYAPVYQCACGACSAPCAAIEPCTHPCRDGFLLPPHDGGATIACPFAGDGGLEIYCTPPAEHCCEPPPGQFSDCRDTATACGDPSVDWRCERPSDCGASELCCVDVDTSDGGIPFADTPQCATFTGAVRGTSCRASCDAAQLVACDADAECPNGERCWPVASHGVAFGLCH